jgi:glycosyltransferase involved in cell wall biosynthesis
MSRARAGWQTGIYPAHHLFGSAYLDQQFEVVDVRYRDHDLLARGSKLLRHRLGDLGLELRATGRARRGSIVYAAQADDVAGLAALRSRRLFPIPIVGVVHGVRVRGPLGHAAFTGLDHAIALCDSTRAALIAAGMSPDRVSVVSWGPDLEFPAFATAPPAAPDAPLVSTGKTGRDLDTLLAAIGRTGIAARIYGDREALARGPAIPAGVEIVDAVPPPPRPNAPSSYAHTVQDLRSAAVIAIPLRNPYPLHGLTELADAIASGRPVIATRAPYFDLDLEAIGCGWWVAEGDVAGWAAAISEALADRSRLAEMGETGRRWAARNWNARLFADGVRRVLLRCREAGSLARPPRGS